MSEYGTHLPVLRQITEGIKTVLELGGGDYSTPFFLGLPIERLVTVEPDASWAERIKTDDPRHEVISQVPALDFFDLILVDNGTSIAERANMIRHVSDAKPFSLVVVHDWEQPDYRQAATFDHTVSFDRLLPWTGVMWNEGPNNWRERVHRIAPPRVFL